MLGAIIGDIVGSRFEWHNIKTKQFDFLTHTCFFTDDSVMSIAVAAALLESGKSVDNLGAVTVRNMQEIGQPYPNCGYGGSFYNWMYSKNPRPYNSYGNGAAMRVSACGFAADSLEEAATLSKAVTEVSHNHPEGLKGAEATTVAIYMAKTGSSILEIRDYIDKHYYPMNFTLDGIRDSYKFNETCQDTVPQALMAFFESTSFEDAIRNAISIGGDSDTLAAITGGVAEAYYGIPEDIRKHALTFLDDRLLKVLNAFEAKYGISIEKDERRSVSTYGKKVTGEQLSMLDAVEATEAAAHADDIVSESTSANQLYNYLYEDCNILRGPIDQDDYKSYVIPILFLKRISDVYDEEKAAAEQEYGELIELYDDEELYTFSVPDGCHWVDIRNVTEDVGKAIVDAMMGIEQANPDTLAGLFSSFDDANWTDKNKLTDERLKNLIEHMSSLQVGNKNYSADVMGDAYEYLIKKFADMSKKNAGEFYTPRSVVKLMVQLLQPKSGESVYDPACGTGGMLIEAVRNMADPKQSYGKIYGQEKNLSTSAIARVNLALHGVKEVRIRREDTLRKPLFIHNGQLQQFDCVLANPPFGLDHWGAEIFENDQYGRNIWGSPTDSNADYAWLQHMVKSMRPGTGRCAVVMPQGVLFHGGREGAIR